MSTRGQKKATRARKENARPLAAPLLQSREQEFSSDADLTAQADPHTRASAEPRRRSEKAAARAQARDAAYSQEREQLRAANAHLQSRLESIAENYFALDRALCLIDLNVAAERTIGRARADILGRPLTDFFPDTSMADSKNLYRVLETGAPEHFEMYSSVLELWQQVHVFAAPFGLEIYARDITTRLKASEELRRLFRAFAEHAREIEIESTRWRAAVEALADEVWVCDVEGNATLINLPAAAAGLYEFEQRPLREILSEIHILTPEGEPRPLEAAPLLRSLRGEIVRGEEIMCDPLTGEQQYRQFGTAPMRDAAGSITGAVGIIRDITAQKLVERELKKSNERVREILESINDVFFALDRDWRFIFANQRAVELAQRPLEELIGQNVWDAFPQWLGSPFEANARKAMTEREPVSFEIDWARTQSSYDAHVYPSAEGISVHWIDTTERRRAVEQLTLATRDLEERARQIEQRNRELELLNQMGDLLQVCLNAQEAYRVLENSAAELFPETGGALYVLSENRELCQREAVWGELSAGVLLPVFPVDDCWALRRGRMHVVRQSSGGLVCAHVNPSGGAEELRSALCIPMIAQGEILGLLHLQSLQGDVTEVSQRLAATVAEQLALALASLKLRETLREQAIRDPLTGLFNRRYFNDALDRELLRAARQCTALSVLLLDLDHFKRVNDAYGHAVGDSLLRALAELLSGLVREEDIVCRYGGEEFAVLFPNTTGADVAHRAEDLRSAIANLPLQFLRSTYMELSASVGIAVYPLHGSTADLLLRAADAALYQAKEQGRNRVVVAA